MEQSKKERQCFALATKLDSELRFWVIFEDPSELSSRSMKAKLMAMIKSIEAIESQKAYSREIAGLANTWSDET